MRKVLLSFVGKRDPYNMPQKTEGSILTICAEVAPDIVYLFPSSGEGENATEERARQVVKLYQAVAPECEFRILPLEVEDVTDFVELSEAFDGRMEEVIGALRKENNGGLDGYSFHLNCSSGTQQMAALGYIFASLGRIPGITRWQAKDPGYVKPDEPRTRRIEADILTENSIIRKIKEDVENFNFYAVKDGCEKLAEIAFIEERRDKAMFLSKLFGAYIHMDNFYFADSSDENAETAQTALRALDAHSEGYEESVRSIFQKQRDFVEDVVSAGNKEAPVNLTELYFNMQRSFRRGAYAAALACWRRIFEGGMYFLLRERYKINPRDIWSEDNDPENRRKLAGLYQNNANYGNDPVFIDFQRAQKALKNMHGIFSDDDFSGVLRKPATQKQGETVRVEDKAETLNQVRNKSIMAHGMGIVSREQAQEALELTKIILNNLIPETIQMMEDYPFTSKQVRRLVNRLLP